MTDIKQALIDIKQALHDAHALLAPTSPSAQIDAEVLLAYVLGSSRTFLYTYPEKKLALTQSDTYRQLIEKRCAGVPIAYLTGTREFWSLPLHVDESTLIPRPETELLVTLALMLQKNLSTASVLDLGTGSGAVALALASERPSWHILASDINQATVEIARYNASHLGLSNVDIVCSDWFSSLPEQQFDTIVSNPPYIATNDVHLEQGDVRFEPQRALVSGIDGLNAIRHLIQHSYHRLLPGGLLLLEHGYMQKQAVTMLLNTHGYEQVHCWQDWQGQDRVSGGWRRK